MKSVLFNLASGLGLLLIGLTWWINAYAEASVEGYVRLASGAPVPGARVRLFDLADLRAAPLGTTTEKSGRFILPFGNPGGGLPEQFELGANYPNPFNPSTLIPYQLPSPMHVRLEVFNLLGQRIATLVDGEQPAGFHAAVWHATDAAGQAVGAGVYLYRLSGAGAKITRRMLLIDGQAGISSAGLGGPSGVGRTDRGGGEAAPAYGLTVSGPGLVPYVDPAFRLTAGMAPVKVVVETPGNSPRAKVASGGVLGDVDNTGRVDFFDALLVALYSRDSSIVMPNNGDISLGDVNADGQVDLSDAWLIAAYLNDPSDPSLPAGIGEAVGAAASLSPDPSTVTFADDGAWHRFTVDAGEPVSVVVNPGADTPRLEITTRSGPGNYCPAEADDDQSCQDGQAIYLAGCAAGAATVELRREADGTVLGTYTFEVTTSPADLVVQWVSASDSTLTPGQSFMVRATVRNQGTGQSAATTLRWYRSTNRTISTRDTEVGTDPVRALGASRTSPESIRLTAPSSAVGQWYYGACVASVGGESAGNNCSRGVRVRVDGRPVTIPDPNLRRAIEATLGKGRGAPIAVAEMESLGEFFQVVHAGISDLTGLEYATNLPELFLGANEITDISALAGLTNLQTLALGSNEITDISALAGLTNLQALALYSNEITDISALDGLTNLTELYLGFNPIQDISALAGLTNLQTLRLNANEITDISALAGLTNLQTLRLNANEITDISALGGLTNLTELYLGFNPIQDISGLVGLPHLATLEIRGNPLGSPLSESSINNHIPALKSRDVRVKYDFYRVGDFDIEIVYLSSFTERQKERIQYGARRWMAVITKDLPDYTIAQNRRGQCGGQSWEIPAGERIDDLRIYVSHKGNRSVPYGQGLAVEKKSLF